MKTLIVLLVVTFFRVIFTLLNVWVLVTYVPVLLATPDHFWAWFVVVFATLLNVSIFTTRVNVDD
jgi:hypothetical protein